MSEWVDFRAVKDAVSMEMVLGRYGVKLRRVNDHYLRGRCPMPTHRSEESKNSFGVDIVKNIWSCHSQSCIASSGRRGGNVLDFVALAESCSIQQAAEKLQSWFGVGVQSKPQSPAPEKIAPKKVQAPPPSQSEEGSGENKPLGFKLKGVDTEHPYIASRGISKEIAQQFGVGFFGGRGSMQGRFIIPIHDERGELVAYAGRSIDGSEPKYKFPSGFQKSLVLFNRHRVTGGTVVLVEGFFACMRVSQAGFSCVALMGRTLSEQQQKLLAGMRVILLLDGDEPGKESAREIVGKLSQTNYVRVVPLLGQPDEQPKAKLKALLAPVI